MSWTLKLRSFHNNSCKEWPRAVPIWDYLKEETTGSIFMAKWDGVQMPFNWIAIFGKDQWRISYISTWEVMNQWQPWKEEEKLWKAHLSWHKFSAALCGRWAGSTSAPGPGVSRCIVVPVLFGPTWYWFLFRLVVYVQRFFHNEVIDASGYDTSNVRLRSFGWSFTEKQSFQQGLPRQD